MPGVSELLRRAGWRQGCLVGLGDQAALLDASVDRAPESGDIPVRLIAVTQDCDLVAEPEVEPFVEFIVGSRTDPIEPLYQHGRNPRLLHLQTVGEHGPGSSLLFSIHDRFRVPKKVLSEMAVDRQVRLQQDDADLLRRWIAKRYTRSAFPDTFNARLDAVDDRLERLFKSVEGQVITGVFVDVPNEEFIDGRSYEIAVRISAKSDAWNHEGTLAALDRFEERLSSILDDCDGIIVSDDDIHTLPEHDLTLAQLRQYRRFDRDYRSVPQRDGVGQPADGGGEL